MKAGEVIAHLHSLDDGWVDWSCTVDTFKAGGPESNVTSIAVGWKAHMHTLEQAHAKGCDLFVCHEPLFYDHYDRDTSFFDLPAVEKKIEWLAETGMTIMRCHDVWDQVPGIGIPDSWASLLGLTDPLPGTDGMTRLFDVTGRTAMSVAEQVATALDKRLGTQNVNLIGDPYKSVTKLAIGTGAGTPFITWLREHNVDIAVVTDDGYTFWREGALAIDHGIPLVVVNHCASEDHGMELLAQHLREQFTDMPVHYLPQGATVQHVPPPS
jgi:putative NIF3 family GTP cyclohydrolase 1 type 2